MDAKLWLKLSFSKKSIPNWPCSSCGNGVLSITSRDFRHQETEESKASHAHDDFDHDWVTYRFGCLLKCSNSNCQEIVACIGTGGVDHFGYGMDASFDEVYQDYFIPLYFVPALNLFKIKPNCPAEISKQIVKAFSLYWCDISACANQIRIALEMIMDNHRIKRTYLNDRRKRKPLALQIRIDTFGRRFPKVKDQLTAIKWIGNFGSHVGELERVDLINAFTLLEYCIDHLYDNREKEVAKITKDILRSPKQRKRKN
jgi:hypothetical protein